MLSLLIVLGSLFVSLVLGANATNSTSLDPITNFCSRLYHQSSIKNGSLYIDGGLEVFVPENKNGAAVGNKTIGYNTHLLRVDMTTSWDWKKNISIIALNKTANPSTGTSPPLVVQAALYPGSDSDQNIYLYGGTVSWLNTSFHGWQYPNPSQYSLWSYNTVTGVWNQYDVTLNAPSRPYGGAYTEASDLGLAFWLDGAVNNGSSNVSPGPDFNQALGGLVVIDTDNQTAANLTTAPLGDRFPREGGALTYISGIGPKGIVVAIGGATKSMAEANVSSVLTDTNVSSERTFVSLNTIDVFDVASLYNGSSNGVWYSQNVTGDIPEPRTDFCVVTAPAPDNSSFNIYLYGGRNATTSFDDIYVLSLPSFRWINIYIGQSPRWGHTCHFVGNSQMITVGGLNTFNLENGCDWETKSVGVYSLSTLTWGSVYTAPGPQYTIPDLISKVVGGGPHGGATLNGPMAGFDSSGMAQLFTTVSNNTSNTDNNGTFISREPDQTGVSGSAITGATVGSLVGVAVIVGLVFYLLRHRKSKTLEKERLIQRHRELDATEKKKPDFYQPGHGPESATYSPPPPSELPSASELHEASADYVLHELDSNKRISKYKQVSELGG